MIGILSIVERLLARKNVGALENGRTPLLEVMQHSVDFLFCPGAFR